MAGQSRTEKPTPQRLREARLRGDIAVSPELIGSAVAIVGVVVLQQQGGRIVEDLQALLARDILLSGSRGLDTATLGARLAADGWSALTMVFPIMAATAIGAVAIGIANTRGLMSLKPL